MTLVGGDDSVPYDRPNLSKDYLAGNAPEEWIPLRTAAFYEERQLRLVLGRRVTSIDVAGKRVHLDDDTALEFGALLLATGAEPIRLPASVAPDGRVLYLRTLADSRAIIAAAKAAKRAVVGSKYTSWRQSTFRWNVCSVVPWVTSCAMFTNPTASYFTWAEPWPTSTQHR